ncbi:MAG: hypothetical protein OXU20_21380 [Myxococcales bacterium]|nr:hypothetical protein [Myxococcales bacterium]
MSGVGRRPRALIVYFSLTGQTSRVVEGLISSWSRCGWDTEVCRIHLEDPRYPLAHPVPGVWRFLLRWIPPQLAHRTGDIRLDPPEPSAEPDLVVIGSPTWWFNPALPIVSFMQSQHAEGLLQGKPFAVMTICRSAWAGNLAWVRKRGEALGGRFVGHLAFRFPGNTAQSMLAFIHKFKHDRVPTHAWGVPLHPYGIQDDHLAAIPAFVRKIADELG